MITELVSTITVFLTMKNREIIKSALGFIKVATVALPPVTVEPHLPVLVPALLGWVHDHKNHFKSKTVHIFERMMRKFGAEAILLNAPAGGERKVLEGIKKRKESAKRKKAAGGGDEDGDEDEEVSSAKTCYEDRS
jgi:ribosomal RNA-processing protein 12